MQELDRGIKVRCVQWHQIGDLGHVVRDLYTASKLNDEQLICTGADGLIVRSSWSC